MYIPLHNEYKRKYFIRIPLVKLGFFTVSLPLFAFVICVVLTIYKDFEKANNTHCKVPNYLPSISASIGAFEPQRSIWQSAIYIHVLPRFYIIFLRWLYYLSTVDGDYNFMVNIAIILNIIENLALVGLTYWDSNEYYPYHEFCFKTFIGTSIFYMVFICILLTRYRRKKHMTHTERKSVRIKWRTFVIYVMSFACAAYFFLRHNSHCEPYVYSMFGFAEYIVVVSNIVFHLTCLYDLPQEYVIISKHGLSVQ